MNISVKETTVFEVFHPDAHALFNICSDLKKVAWELWNPTYRLKADDKTIQLFRAFAPMLCKRPGEKDKIEQTVKDMEGRTFFIEEKLDGERMQLHKRGNEYFYCSRLECWSMRRQRLMKILEKARIILTCTESMSDRGL